MVGTLALVWLGAAAGASAEEMSVRATSSLSEISVPGTSHITYRLEVAAGSEARRFGVHVRPNYFFGQEQADRAEAPPIQAFVRDYSFEGDLQGEGGVSEEGLIACGTPRGRGHHGGESTAAHMNFYLPAGGAGAVVARYAVLPTPPWPATDYRARFTVSPPHRNLGPPGYDLTRPPAPGAVPTVDLLTPAPVVHGRRGVRIHLQTDPPLSPSIVFGRQVEIPPDTLIGIAGSTDPPLRRQRIVLESQLLDGDHPPVDLAAVRTDDAGRFRLRAWRPYQDGRYALSARYTSQSPELADDFTCPWGFRAGAGDARPELRVDAARGHVRGGAVEVPVRCVGAPPMRCQGRLRLTGRRWRSTARYDLPAPGVGAVRLAVPGRHGSSALLKASPKGAARPTPARRLSLRR